MKDLYDTTKNLQEIVHKQANRLKTHKNGKVLTTTEEQLARWAEHFKELNRPPPDVTPEINRADVLVFHLQLSIVL
jgi:hypothetical protein